MKKHKFEFTEREGYQTHNGNGGSTYTSSCTFYTLFVDGKEVFETDRKWQIIEYINKTYFSNKWKKDDRAIAKLKKQAEALLEEAKRLEKRRVTKPYTK